MAKKKSGPKPKLQNVAQVIAVLEKVGGIKAAAYRELGVARATLDRFIEKHPTVQDALDNIKMDVGDIAEGQIIKAIKAGDLPTCRWYLELQHKDRGYVRRVEQTGKNGGPVQTEQKPSLDHYTKEELDVLIAAEERRQQEQEKNTG